MSNSALSQSDGTARCLAVIPARGGSKGLPGKNIRTLAGKPLIAWTIETALRSRIATHVIVSTDDTAIANIALQYGAQVPFLRPAEIASDTTSCEDVVLHAINFFSAKGQLFDHILLLQPTSPLRIAADIDDAFIHMRQSNAPSCVSVCLNEHSPYNDFFLDKNGGMKRVLPRSVNMRRQDYPLTYRLNGAFYCVETPWFLQHKVFIGEETTAYVMPAERSIDIDSLLDFTFAEVYTKKLLNEICNQCCPVKD